MTYHLSGLEALTSVSMLVLVMIIVVPWIDYALTKVTWNPFFLIGTYWKWCDRIQEEWRKNKS